MPFPALASLEHLWSRDRPPMSYALSASGTTPYGYVPGLRCTWAFGGTIKTPRVYLSDASGRQLTWTESPEELWALLRIEAFGRGNVGALVGLPRLRTIYVPPEGEPLPATGALDSLATSDDWVSFDELSFDDVDLS